MNKNVPDCLMKEECGFNGPKIRFCLFELLLNEIGEWLHVSKWQEKQLSKGLNCAFTSTVLFSMLARHDLCNAVSHSVFPLLVFL